MNRVVEGGWELSKQQVCLFETAIENFLVVMTRVF